MKVAFFYKLTVSYVEVMASFKLTDYHGKYTLEI